MTHHYKIAGIDSEVETVKTYLMPYKSDRVLQYSTFKLVKGNGDFKDIRVYTRANYHGHSYLLQETVKLFSILYPHMRYQVTDVDGKLSWSFDNTSTNCNLFLDVEQASCNSYNYPLHFTLENIEEKMLQARQIIMHIEEKYHKSHGMEALKSEIELYCDTAIVGSTQDMKRYLDNRRERLLDILQLHGNSWELEGYFVVNDAFRAIVNESLSA